MANLHRGAQKDPSGKILEDKWVWAHPGHQRTPKPHRTFHEPVNKLTQSKTMREALESMSEYWVPGKAPDPPGVSEAALGRIRRDVTILDHLRFRPAGHSMAAQVGCIGWL